MQKEAVVLESGRGRARCISRRTPACGSCAGEDGCGIAPGKDTFIFEAEDPIGVGEGMRVLVELPDRVVLSSAFIAYGLPTLGLLLGAGLGAIWGDAGSALGALFGAAFAWRFARRWRHQALPHIVRRLDE